MASPHPDSGDGWRNLGEQQVVATPWFALNTAEVELPGGRRIDHYLLRLPPVVMTAMLDDQDRVLLLWRHRFIPDSWGWELPSGIADPTEDLAAAASRQALAESGWEPVEPRPLLQLEPDGALTNRVSHIYWTRRFMHRGPPPADFEAERIEWISLGSAPSLVAAGKIKASCTAAALLTLRASRPT